MFSRNPAFLGQVPLILPRLGITAEEYTRELQRRREQLEPPPQPSPKRYVSCIPSWQDRQVKERLCKVLDALNSAPQPGRERALYEGEFQRQWDQLLEGQKECMEGWIKTNCPNLLTEYGRQQQRMRPAVPSTYRFAPTPTAVEFTQALPPPPPPPVPEPPGPRVPSFDPAFLERLRVPVPTPTPMPVPSVVEPVPGAISPMVPSVMEPIPAAIESLVPSEGCPEGFTPDPETGECIPIGAIPTGYQRPRIPTIPFGSLFAGGAGGGAIPFGGI